MRKASESLYCKRTLCVHSRARLGPAGEGEGVPGSRKLTRGQGVASTYARHQVCQGDPLFSAAQVLASYPCSSISTSLALRLISMFKHKHNPCPAHSAFRVLHLHHCIPVSSHQNSSRENAAFALPTPISREPGQGPPELPKYFSGCHIVLWPVNKQHRDGWPVCFTRAHTPKMDADMLVWDDGHGDCGGGGVCVGVHVCVRVRVRCVSQRHCYQTGNSRTWYQWELVEGL